MGKVSPKEKESMTPKQRRRRGSINKYLKPGALAQLRYTKAAKPWIDVGKNRSGLLDDKKIDYSGRNDLFGVRKDSEESESMMSPKRCILSPPVGSFDLLKQISPLQTPKTPMMVNEACKSESRLEALPMDIMVKIMCHLHHDQLRAVFHVSQRIRKAVLHARQLYFNYTTPNRSRQEMLRTMTPLAVERWPFASKGDRRGIIKSSPHTPKAPKHGPRPPSKLKCTEIKQIAAVLFQEPSFSSRCLVPSVLSKPQCKNRVLFYEDELCQAVAQNKLR